MDRHQTNEMILIYGVKSMAQSYDWISPEYQYKVISTIK